VSPLPVVDISPYRHDPHSDGSLKVAEALVAACHNVGFAYITGHGVDPALHDRLFELADSFFDLPLPQRQTLAIANSAAFRGYTTLGDERTNGKSDWREQIDFGPEQPAPETLDGEAWLRLRGPNQWPSALPDLKPTMLTWMDQMNTLGLTALRALAVGLRQPADRFDDAFLPEADTHVKVINYPPRPDEATEQGVGTHHDTGVLTFIAQDSTGLQVSTVDGFVDAPPLEDGYIMNLGEMLQRSTNGYLRATPHRVVSPVDAARTSIAFFFNPSYESVFEAIELPPDLARQAPGGEHQMIDDEIHAVFGDNNLRTRLRSHPDVAARHYADLS